MGLDLKNAMPKQIMAVRERRLGFALLLAVLLHLVVLALVKPTFRPIPHTPGSPVLEIRIAERAASIPTSPIEMPPVMEPNTTRGVRRDERLHRRPVSAPAAMVHPVPEKRSDVTPQSPVRQEAVMDAGMPDQRPGSAEPAKSRALDFSNLQEIIRRSAADGDQRDDAQRRALPLTNHTSAQLAQAIAKAFGHDQHSAIAGIDVLADGTVKVMTAYGTTYCFRENERFAQDSPVRPTEIPMTCP